MSETITIVITEQNVDALSQLVSGDDINKLEKFKLEQERNRLLSQVDLIDEKIGELNG